MWPFKKRKLIFRPHIDTNAIYFHGYSKGLQKGQQAWTEHAVIVLETAGADYLNEAQIKHLVSLIKMEPQND